MVPRERQGGSRTNCVWYTRWSEPGGRVRHASGDELPPSRTYAMCGLVGVSRFISSAIAKETDPTDAIYHPTEGG